MHRVFQRDLCRLRLRTARAYVQLLGQGPMSTVLAGGAQVRCNAEVRGLMGPVFKVCVRVQNSG